jgi:DNA-binding transcriptional LysR family regulator
MIDRLEALAALARRGTTGRAAADLRITQSAVSKRIAALEAEVGRPLLERAGRRVVLTPDGARLLRDAEPLLAELRLVVEGERTETGGDVAIGVSESVLSSWGAAMLARARAATGIPLAIHAHRSPVVLDRVRAGEYLLGIVAGEAEGAPDLSVEPLTEEELVIVPSRLERLRLRPGAALEVIGIEPASATWAAIRPRVERLGRRWGIELRVVAALESYAAVVQMARAGFGHALAPAGIARALGVADSRLVRLGITRPVSIAARRLTLARPRIRALVAALERPGEP